MDAIREQLQKPIVAGIIGVLIGLIVGWFVIGWGLWPVEYTGAQPKDMLYQEQIDYLRATIEGYGTTRDSMKAIERYNKLGENAQRALSDIVANPSGLSPDLLQAFATLTLAQPQVTPLPGQIPEAGVTQPAPAATEEEGSGNIFRTILLSLCVVTVVVVAVLALLYFLRSKGMNPVTSSPAMEAQQAAREAQYKDYVSTGAEPPLSQFMASYKIGDDLFDDSFSIDSPTGEFLGECGVGISETIGVGDPKRVTAFEVWLFDKTDIQTVTKVLMSTHAYEDDSIRQRLAAKGEPILVRPGIEAVLETESLTMVARVESMGYGEGALPPESFFDRFILELSVWPKA
jgi:hypothetical protein